MEKHPMTREDLVTACQLFYNADAKTIDWINRRLPPDGFTYYAPEVVLVRGSTFDVALCFADFAKYVAMDFDPMNDEQS